MKSVRFLAAVTILATLSAPLPALTGRCPYEVQAMEAAVPECGGCCAAQMDAPTGEHVVRSLPEGRSGSCPVALAESWRENPRVPPSVGAPLPAVSSAGDYFGFSVPRAPGLPIGITRCGSRAANLAFTPLRC